MAVDLKFIQDFLRKVEGKAALLGYIPAIRNKDGKGKNYIGASPTTDETVAYPAYGHFTAFTAMGASGVTIATGIDLGQTNFTTFTATYHVSQYLAERFNPYYGRKRDDALKALFTKQIDITKGEADEIDTGVHTAYLWNVASAYNSCNAADAFVNLPPQAQAAIFSLLYQNGCTGGQKKNPAAWAALVAGDWAKASNLFINGEWPAYKDRHKQEGQLLAQIKSGGAA
jgi:hypothetical protein